MTLLTRQALEQELARRAEELLSGSSRGSVALQLITLRLLGDSDEAREAAATWHGLSEACHHHGYELSPLPAQLDAWLVSVEGFVEPRASQIEDC
ncbi:MAG: hypothetical protein GY884_31675 [Proteobacteria bacterium]|nr:hypothetical protein [Pseudomonadota bacterium]